MEEQSTDIYWASDVLGSVLDAGNTAVNTTGKKIFASSHRAYIPVELPQNHHHHCTW